MRFGTKRALLGAGRKYLYKIRGVEPSNLVGVWLQNEQSGAVSYDLSGHAFNGAYTTATLGQPGVPGMRMPAVSYDGTNDYNDIHSAGLANDNLLSNPGFETAGGGGADVWANWSETAGDGALANESGGDEYEGSDAAKVTAGANKNTRVLQNITTVAGKKYRLRFWTKNDATNAGRYRIYDNDNSAAIKSYTFTAASATYVAVTHEFESPAGCTSVGIELWCPFVDTKVAYFDACEVRSMDGFLGDEGTLLAWAKVSAAVWADGTNRWIVALTVDAQNTINIIKAAAANTLYLWYEAGDVQETPTKSSVTTTDFMCLALTWSKSGDKVIAYYNGAQEGATATGVGVWLGDLANTKAIIGASVVGVTGPYSGPIGPVALWNKALSATQIANLSKV